MTRQDTEIVIPELEEAMTTYNPLWKEYTKTEIAIIKKYYGKVDVALIAKQLKRSKEAVQNKAIRMGLSRKGKA